MRGILFSLLFIPGLLSAATFTVTSTGDTSDTGTLRWAIEQHFSQGGDNRIVFRSLAGATITVTSKRIGETKPPFCGGEALRAPRPSHPRVIMDQGAGPAILHAFQSDPYRGPLERKGLRT